MIAYKLLKVRKDGTIGPLFINQKQRITVGVWYDAVDHPTKGYKHRPYWHCCARPEAPHLSEKGRAWYKVEIEGVQKMKRPEHQGGTWYLADKMKVLEAVA